MTQRASRLRDRVCVVTGASRGIGRALAEALLAVGARVEGIGRDRERLAGLAAEHPGFRAWVCDLTEEAEVEASFRRIAEAAGRVDVLVNNAGTGVFGPLEAIAYEDFESCWRVNVGGTFLATRAVVPLMKEQRSGQILNVASVTARKGYAEQSIYGATKHAILGLTRALAVELAPHGIEVSSLCPGGVDTELIGRARPELDRSGLIRPEDLAEAALFLLDGPPSLRLDNLNPRRLGSPPDFG